MSTLTYKAFEDMLRQKAFNTQKSIENVAKHIQQQLQRRARKNATRYPKRITGNLYDSIIATVKPTTDSLDISLTAGNEVAYYALFVEKGTSRGIAPRYYLQRAFDSVNEKIPQKLSAFLRLYLQNPKYYGQQE